jgi:hypothetical protein
MKNTLQRLQEEYPNLKQDDLKKIMTFLYNDIEDTVISYSSREAIKRKGVNGDRELHVPLNLVREIFVKFKTEFVKDAVSNAGDWEADSTEVPQFQKEPSLTELARGIKAQCDRILTELQKL